MPDTTVTVPVAYYSGKCVKCRCFLFNCPFLCKLVSVFLFQMKTPYSCKIRSDIPYISHIRLLSRCKHFENPHTRCHSHDTKLKTMIYDVYIRPTTGRLINNCSISQLLILTRVGGKVARKNHAETIKTLPAESSTSRHERSLR